MTAEYAGITIIVDQGANRTVINIPKATDVESFVLGVPVESVPDDIWEAVTDRFRSRSVSTPQTGILFRPIGEYTIREEPNPMHPTAPALSEHEQAEADRFGIHDQDESEGVW